MALPPIQQFRPEDFPELEGVKWASKLFSKLNGLARQTQYGFNSNLSVSQNLSGFWWEGVVGPRRAATNVNYPYSIANPSVFGSVTVKQAAPITAFPFEIPNKFPLRKVNGVFVAQAFDYTDRAKSVLPAMLDGVAWEQLDDKVKIYAINGMYIGGTVATQRNYFVRLLVLSE